MIRTLLRRALFLTAAVALTTAFFLSVQAEDPAKTKTPESTTAAAEKPLDITAEAQAMNSDRFAAPPTKFRGGQATPRRLDEKTFTANDKGYTIKLPSNAPIPTPTVYDGKVYVSGGFHSKEFYCFDAATGKLVWGRDLDDDGPSSAVCSDGVTIFNTESCTIFALDALTGDLLWSHWLGDPLTSAPTIADGKVFSSYPANGGAEAHLQMPNNAGNANVPGTPQNPFGAASTPNPNAANGNTLAPASDPFAPAPSLQPNAANPPPAPNGNTPSTVKNPFAPASPPSPNVATGQPVPPAAAPQQAAPQQVAVPPQQAVPQPAAPPQTADAKPRPQASHVLACFDLKTGKILWQRWIDSDVMSAPVAVDGELYVTSFAGVVYKFKQNDGTILSATRSRATSAPIVVDNQVLVTKRADAGGAADAPTEQIAGLDRASAKTNFAGEAKAAKYLDAEVQAGTAQKGLAMKLDAANGFGGGIAPTAANSIAAAANIGQDNVSTLQAFQGSRPAYSGGFCFNTMGNEFLCSSTATGKVEWKLELTGDLEKLGGFLASPPAAVADQIFLATLNGEVLRLDSKAGKILEAYAVGSPIRAQPAIEGGRIYVGTQDGKLVCIDTGNPKFTGWSTWGGNVAHTGVAAK